MTESIIDNRRRIQDLTITLSEMLYHWRIDSIDFGNAKTMFPALEELAQDLIDREIDLGTVEKTPHGALIRKEDS